MSVTLREQEQVIAKLLKYIQQIPNIPCSVGLERFDGRADSIMLQQLAGTVKVSEDMIGGYAAQFPFAVYYRVQADDTLARLKATSTLMNIGRYFDAQSAAGTLPTLATGQTATAIEMRAFPNMATKGNDGTETYQAIFAMEYEQERIIEEVLPDGEAV